MGQLISEPLLNYGSLEDNPFSTDDAIKLERLLRELSEYSDETKIIFKWEKTLDKKAKSSVEQWCLASFAIKTLEKWGKHKLMLTFSVYQVELAYKILDDNYANEKTKPDSMSRITVMADSQLNLARANLALSQYRKAMDYTNKCLVSITNTRGSNRYANRLSGYAYLCRGNANLGTSSYNEALVDFENTFGSAHKQNDKPLECLACCSMCTLYMQIKDYEKAIFFSLKASDILQEHGKEWNKRFLTLVQLRLAEAYRKVGKLDEAMHTAEDAMRNAIESQDRHSQAYGMLCFADIHRVRRDTDRAIPRYDSAAGMMVETGDQYGHVLATAGKAKAFFRAREYSKSLSEYDTSLRIAEYIQNKMLCMRIYGEMTLLYLRIANQELAKNCSLRYHQYLDSMQLQCGLCETPIGEKHEQLEALPCSHFFHLKCVSEHGLHLLGQLACPVCRKQVMNRNSNQESL